MYLPMLLGRRRRPRVPDAVLRLDDRLLRDIGLQREEPPAGAELSARAVLHRWIYPGS